MKLFGQIVRTVVNTALLPVAAVADVVTLGAVIGENSGFDGPFELRKTHTGKAIERLKEEAQDHG